jgi:hypothetical protein
MLASLAGKSAVADDGAATAAVLAALCRALLQAATAGHGALITGISRSVCVLAARCAAWPADQVVPGLLAIVSGCLGGLQHATLEQQCATLHLLSALPEAAAARETALRPERRDAVRQGLRRAPELSGLLHAALQPGQPPTLQLAAMALTRSWCDHLLVPPSGLSEASVAQLHAAAADPHLLHDAAQTVASLYAAAAASPAPAGGGPLQALLLQHLPAAVCALNAQADVNRGENRARAQNATLTLLDAARGSAAAAGAAAEAGGVPAFLAQQLLQLLAQGDEDVTLSALGVWDDWLAAGAAGAAGPCCRPPGPEISALLQGLLRRVQLPPGLDAARATADGRDLPASCRTVRREAAETIRLAAAALGPAAALQQSLAAAATGGAAWEAMGRGGAGWEALEASLYVLNLLPIHQPGVCGAATFGQLAVLGRGALEPAAPKLAGTALTLIGGLGARLPELAGDARGAEVVASLAEALLQLVLVRQGADCKLACNAATTVERLVLCPELAALLSRRLPSWAAALQAAYLTSAVLQQPGGGPHAAGTRRALLASLCRLGPPGADVAGVLAHHAGQAMLELQQQQCSGHHARLEACAMHLQALGIVLEESAAPGAARLDLSGAGADLLGLVEAAAGAACQQDHAVELLHPLCQAAAGLAAALPATVGGRALALVAPLAALPPLPRMEPAPVLAAVRRASAAQNAAAGHVIDVAWRALGPAMPNADDGDWLHAALELCCTLAQRWPAACAASPLHPLAVRCLQRSARCFHRAACEAGLRLAGALLGCGAEVGAGDRAALRAALQGGPGVAVVQAMLAGACGAQPPYMLAPIAETLHAAWLVGDGNTVASLLYAAVLESPPAEAGWGRWKPEAAEASLRDMLGEACRGDAKRFKRLFKALCGGKKKGHCGEPPALARAVH